MNVCIIPARGGSRRIPHKNIREFHGKPIIAYSIETAVKSKLFSLIYVSTDDDEIADIASGCGALVLRRLPQFSTDDVGTQEVMGNVLSKLMTMERIDVDSVACCLYATAPLLTVENLTRGFDAWQATDCYGFSLSVCSDPLYDAGQFYWGYADSFINGVELISDTSVMVPLNPKLVCDINTEDDWKRAEQMYATLHPEMPK